ncbi:MAG: endolytic transglycosylase MltG [Patescibacteria group bacterium]
MYLPVKSQHKAKPWLRFLVFLIVVVVLFIVWGGWQVIKQPSSPAEFVNFKISTGENVKTISNNLKESGLISSRSWFEIWIYLTGTDKKFLAGEYKLPSGISILNLTRLLTGGVEPTSEVSVRIIEGWTIKDISNYLEEGEFYSASEFALMVTDPLQFNPILIELEISLASKPDNASLEGYLFPDTYRVFRDSTPRALVTKMLDNFAKKFKLEWRQELEKKGYNVWQGVILASIIEREVAGVEDRKLVADIFWRRLQAGQGLEADSTVNYITGKKTPSLSLEDTKLDSPYNTYKYRGLPPGPISNPGSTALEAVAFPKTNDYWYFLTTKEGEVIYSETYEQHIQAKQKYLQ